MEKTKKMLNRDAQQIARLLQRCVETAYVTRTSPAWQAFLAYIDSIIQKGTMDVVVPERRRGACGAAASASGDFRSHSFLSISPSLVVCTRIADHLPVRSVQITVFSLEL